MPYTPPIYPSTIPDTGDLPDRVDDVDWLYAARYNEIKKEMIAIMAELGTLPKGAYADVKTRLDASVAGGPDKQNLVVIVNATNPTYQIDIDADYLQVQDKNLSSVNLTVDITSSGANGLDTGSEAANKNYYIWIIYNSTSDTVAGLLSISDNSPTMPSGYTKKRLLKMVHNDSSSNFVDYSPLMSLEYPDFAWDVDGNKYCTKKIGEQLWIAQNLRVTHTPSGGALTSYLYTDADEEKEGRLYLWADMMNGDGEGGQGIAPDGFHIPTDDEYKRLERYLGMKQSEVDGAGLRGVNEGKMLKSLDDVAGTASNGNNTVGFNELLAGRRATDGTFSERSTRIRFWSSTEGSTGAWRRGLGDSYTTVSRSDDDKANGLSVRCIKD